MLEEMAEIGIQTLLHSLHCLMEDSNEEKKIVIQKGGEKLDLILKEKLDNLRKSNLEYEDMRNIVENLLKSTCMVEENACCEIYEDCTMIVDDYLQNNKKLFPIACINILNEMDKFMAAEKSPCGNDEILLGAKDKKLISAACQFVVSLGIYMNLKPGVSFQSIDKTTFGSLLDAEKDIRHMDERFLLLCAKSLSKLIANVDFGQIIIIRSLRELLGALIQIGYKLAPNNEKEDTAKTKLEQDEKTHELSTVLKEKTNRLNVCKHQRYWCKIQLKKFLENVFQPLVIRELLILQGFGRSKKELGKSSSLPPKWLQKICSKLLSQKLMEKNGLQNILKAIFEEYNMDGKEAAERYEMIGFLVSNCPFQAKSPEEYYKIMSSQVLQLIELKGNDDKTNMMYRQVAANCISWMMKKNGCLTKRLILDQILGPLQKICCKDIGQKRHHDEVINERDITKAIENIHKVIILTRDPPANFVEAVAEISHVFYEVYSFLRSGVSHLKVLVQEILVWLLLKSSLTDANHLLMLFLVGDVNFSSNSATRLTVNPQFELKNGANGGVFVCVSTVEMVVNGLKLEENCSTEQRIVAILSLLSAINDVTFSGNFFVFLLQNLSEALNRKKSNSPGEELLHFDEMVIKLKFCIPIVSMVAAICDKLGDSVIQEPEHILAFIKNTIECSLSKSDFDNEFDNDSLEDDLQNETLGMALGILSLILSTIRLKGHSFDELNEFTDVLQRLESRTKVDSIRKTANDIRVSILTHGSVTSDRLKGDSSHKDHDPSSPEAYDEAMKELVDPLIPTRGHAIIQLSSLLEKGNAKAIENWETLLSLFMDNLSHYDSYIYLAAVRAIASLSKIRHDVVIPRLAKEFAQFPEKLEDEIENRGLYFKGNDQNVKLKKHSAEKRMKIGEALMKSMQSCGPVLPRYSQVILASLLTGVKDKDDDVRASSLSNIGDACKLLRFSVGTILYELMNCISGVLHSEQNIKVKRAAVYVVKLLLNGLGKDVFQVIGDVLRDLYRILKTIVNRETDEILVNFASDALVDLHSIMKQFLFPKENLQKKIHVLTPP